MKKLFCLITVIACISCTESHEELSIDNAPSEELELTEDTNVEDESQEDVEDTNVEDESPEDVEVEIDLPQTWKLFKMTCHTSETCETTGEDMFYQDTYIFSEDMTVLKVRIKDNDTLKIEGVFNVTGTEFETYAFNIDYEGEATPEDIDIISGCYSRKEYLFITEQDEEVLKNDWDACDGPGLFYTQVTE